MGYTKLGKVTLYVNKDATEEELSKSSEQEGDLFPPS